MMMCNRLMWCPTCVCVCSTCTCTTDDGCQSIGVLMNIELVPACVLLVLCKCAMHDVYATFMRNSL